MRATIGINLAVALVTFGVLSSSALAQIDQHGQKYYDDGAAQKGDRSVTTNRGGPGEENPEGGGVQMQETGFYQAGPRDGAFRGAARSVGIGGGGITLPEIKLKLPSIELPHFFRAHHSAKMLYEEGIAPWVSTGFRAVAQKTVGTRGVDETGGRGVEDDNTRSRGTDNCEDLRREYERKIAELQQQLDECEELKKCIKQWQQNHPHASLQNMQNPPPNVSNGRSPVYSPPIQQPVSRPGLEDTASPRRLPVQPASYLQPIEYGQQAAHRLPIPAPSQVRARRLPPTGN